MAFEVSAAGWIDLPAGAARSGELVRVEERLAAVAAAAVLTAGADDLVVALARVDRSAARRARDGRDHLPELREFPVGSWVVDPTDGPLADVLAALDACAAADRASGGTAALVPAVVDVVLPALAEGYRSRRAVASPVAEPSTRVFLDGAARSVLEDRERLAALRF
ncbi:MAG: hypothetical protein ACOYOP_10840 [Microthrixaceae bacterium]